MPRKVVCACGQALAVPDQYPKPAARCSACGGTVPIPPLSAAVSTSPSLIATPIDSPYAPVKQSAPFGEPSYAPTPRPASSDSRVLWVILGLLGTAAVLFCGCGGVLFYVVGSVNDQQQAERRPAAPNPPNFPQPTFPPTHIPSPEPPKPIVPAPPPFIPPTPPANPPPSAGTDDFAKRRIYIPLKFKKLHIESLRKAQEGAKDNTRIVEVMQKNIDRITADLEREMDNAAQSNNLTRAQIEELIREGEEKKW